jgi:cobalt-zinc-cadmium efflux system protein
MVGIALNTGFVLIEVAYGYWSNSMALMADAGHNLSDVLGLVIAWSGATLAKRPPTRRFTYGLKGSSILAALANAVILLVAVGAIMLEAIRRFLQPQTVDGTTVIAVAAVGILINGATAMMFARGRRGDLNIRGAYLHMAADAAVSAAVVVAGGLIVWTHQQWIDPVMSLAVSGVILWSTYGLLKESVAMSLGAAPAGVDVDAVEEVLERLPGVTRVHDLHVWSMSTTEGALTAHLVMPAGNPGDVFLREAAAAIDHQFGIHHCTFQVEVSEDADCHLEPDDVV